MTKESATLSTGTSGNDKGDDSLIAVIGVSGRFPGGANSPTLLWETLKTGRDAVSEANGERWDLGWHNPDSARQNRVYVKSGGFLDQIDQFDADFFGISPREAQQIDPQQRLLLELAWEVFEDAGVAPRSTAGSKTGVFIGISSNDYSSLLGNHWPDAYSNTGSSFSIAANRVSYVYDLHGPSVAVDTACSSSLVCVHQACTAIRNGECSMALAGGVSVIADIKLWLGFSRASMLSPSGRCKSFDETGDGYVRSEGGGLVLLKPLRDAERDGDNIMGVILASGVNSDGRTLGLSMPNGEAQEALLRDLYAEAKVEPERVFYVEAHGTGTSVGDPIECGALGRVLGTPRSDGSVCRIGSVKSNIGHLEPASGIAGLTKALMALKHREIPAQLHFNTPNPKIDFEGWKLEVVSEPTPLPEIDEPVVFGVNSFGFGGTNAHVVLEEYKRTQGAEETIAPPEFLILSANSEAALDALAADYITLLRAPDADWAAVAAGAARCRSPLRNRLVVRAQSSEEAADRLEKWRAGEPVPGTSAGVANTAAVPMAFVYSGNGPQWWGMGRELLAENPVFRATIEAVDATFAPLAGWSLIGEMQRPEHDSRIALTEVAQPMLFAQQMGLTAVLKVQGVIPGAVLGHSVGEVAAACASGALTLEQATHVIFHRSREQAVTAGTGKMAALGVDPETAEEAMAEIGGWLELAAVNGPDSVTVAGDELALARLVDVVTASGKFARVLTLDYPFHTKAMDPIREGLLKSLADLKPSASDTPFISTVDGALLQGDALDADYWFRNVREPVLFRDAVSSLLSEHEVGLFVEIGPHPVLKDYVAQTARSDGATAVSLQTLRRPGPKGPESDVENLATAIAAAHANGASAFEDLFDRPRRLPELPIYPWQRTRHWRGTVPTPDFFVPLEKDHPLLGARLPAVAGQWENPMDSNLLAYLKDHVVQGSVLFPGAGYVEMALAAAARMYGDGVLDIETFEVQRPLVLPENSDPLVQTVVDARDGCIEICSRRERYTEDQTVHVRGRISRLDEKQPRKVELAAIEARMVEKVSADEHYAGAAWRGLDYGPCFQGIRSVRMTDPAAECREALAEVSLDFLSEKDLAENRAHPALFDSCLQATITLIAQVDKRPVSTIPIQFERVRSFAPLKSNMLCHVIVQRESTRSVVVDIHMMDTEGTVLLSLIEARCQKANLTSSAVSPLTSEWWRPDPSATAHGPLSSLPPIARLLEAAQTAAASTGPTDALRKAMDRLAGLYAIEALDQLRPDGDSFDIAGLSRHARIRREHTPMLASLIAMAESEGQIDADGKRWVWSNKAQPMSAAKLWAELFKANPSHQADLLLLAEVGESLAGRLRGQDLPEATAALLDQSGDTAPLGSQRNRIAVAAIEALAADWPADRPIRVLEIGGGSGGVAAWILPLLPPERTDYVFSDTSEAMTSRAERRFGAHKFVRCAVLEPGIPIREQGQPSSYYDLVIASDLMSIGNDACDTLSDVQSVMADGGLMVAFQPEKWPARVLAFGPRKSFGRDDFGQAGFTDAEELAAGSGLFVARKSAPVMPTVADHEALSHLVIAENPDGFAHTVVEALAALGQKTTLTGFPTDDDRVAAFVEQLNRAEHDRVVLLGAKGSGIDLFATQSRRCLTVVALVEAMERTRQSREIALTIVTRGAFPDGVGAAPIDPAEAALWGIGRVIGNEHQGLDLRLVDLHADSEGLDEAGWLADELLRRDVETEVQISGGHRYVNRQRITTEADEARNAGLTSDVYALDFVPQGGLDSLHLRELERQEPGANDVEIAVKAAGLNFRDVLWCMGMLPEEAVEHGFSGPTIGMECAGEVVRVGSDVTHLSVGDRVVAFASSCFGSHVTTDAGSVDKIPDGIEFAAAATIPTTFLTAWYGLDFLARLEEGETILIHGAAGGVGLAAIQIAQLKGATVIGTAGSPLKRRMLELLGVDHVLNSRTLEFADQVMELTGGKGVDVVLNSLAGEAITKSLHCLRPFGRFLEIGKRDLYANSRIGLRPFRNNLSYFGIDADTLLIERPALARRLFADVIEHVRTGSLRPLPHQVVPISRAVEAFRAMQQSRHVGKLVVSMEMDRPGTLPVVRTQNPVRAGGTYLVTGGLGGFGLETARWLAEEGATHLALVSRSGPVREEAQAGIAELERMGVTVHGFAADVSDPESLAAVLATVRSEMAPLIGVIHSAAVIEDAPIIAIEEEQLGRVFQAKMVGAWNLHEQTLNDPLEMFVLYSSSSAVVGNPGQGAYVAANLYLDALALHRRASGRPALSIGWGAIRDAGFLTRHENVADMLKSRTGLDATPAKEALADLRRAAAAGASRVCVARFDLQRLHQMLPAARVPRFLPIVPTGSSALLAPEETLADLLEEMPKSERRAFILERVKENAARVLGTSASQLNAEQPLADLGLDSLMAVELAGTIERDVGQTVPVMQLLGAGSLAEVAEFVAQTLGVEGGGKPASTSKEEATSTRAA